MMAAWLSILDRRGSLAKAPTRWATRRVVSPFEGRLPGLEKKITKQTKNETGRTAMLKYLIVA